jgi:hypothetical protein
MGDRRPAPSADDLTLQSRLYRRQWQRVLSPLALVLIVFLLPVPAGWNLIKAMVLLGLFLFLLWNLKQERCPRCRQPIMLEGSMMFASAGVFWPRHECPTCLWPTPLSAEQHQRLVVDLEFGDKNARRRKLRDAAP